MANLFTMTELHLVGAEELVIEEDRQDWGDRTGFQFNLYDAKGNVIDSYPTLPQARNAARVYFTQHHKSVVVKDDYNGSVYFRLN